MQKKSILGCCALAAAMTISPHLAGGVVQVTDPLPAGTNYWSRTNTYVLNGLCHLLGGSSLFIEPGTVIKGKNLGAAAVQKGGLVVCQNAKIYAEGSPNNTIIFTAENDDVFDPTDIDLYQRGLWGGVILLGNARVNSAIDAAGNVANPKYEVYEGLPDVQVGGQWVHRFGGSNDDDSSGVLRYVSIRHGGAAIEANKEVNALTFGAVGRGTTIEFVEAYATADDGFEFWGGTVNTRYLVSAFNDDDAFDTDQGHSGKHQFLFAIQAPDKRNFGSELNGEPSGLTGAAPLQPYSNFQLYNATVIGAGVGNGGTGGNNDALMIREYAAPRIHNSIYTDFGRRGVNLDPKSGVMLTDGLLTITDNIWWGFSAGSQMNNSITNLAVDSRAEVLWTEANLSNRVVDPMLAGISRTNNGALDPRLQAGSPALSGAKTPSNDGFLIPTSYLGAFGSQDLWIAKWTALYQYGIVVPGGADAPNTVQVTDPLPAGTNYWSRTNTYVLNGLCHLLGGSSLFIEPGTVIKGKNLGAAAVQKGGLVVCQNAKIYAEGSPNNTIIFTAENDDVFDPTDIDLYQRGLWGGVILLGNARVNSAIDAAGNVANPKYEVYEGLPDVQVGGQWVHRFGGSNDDDSSGVLRYVSIRHGGAAIEANKEVNALTFGAVGRGTTIEFVEAYATADDGFEFWGGTVNTRYLVSAFNDDDAFDTDQGHSGKHQFLFAIQAPDKRNFGSELNGEPSGLTGAAPLQPYSNFQLYNATVIGAGVGNGGTGGNNDALMIREYAAPRIHNSIYTDFGRRGVNLDPKSGVMLTDGLLTITDNIWWGFSAGSQMNNSITNLAVDSRAEVLWTEANLSNRVVDPMLAGISRTNNGALDPRLQAGSPALSGAKTPSNDGFLIPTSYLGAFASENWASDWTALGDYAVLSARGARTPTAKPGTPDLKPNPPVLIVKKSTDNLLIRFESQEGYSYQLQSALEMGGHPVSWTNTGTPVAGTGGVLTLTNSIPNDPPLSFYRIVIP
ncbi:MAG TPA: T9SS C-terminal target domain-containing protein [Candidatus Paceibacterota bacterium]|nr:T9SS C-terminal target domain-containing protein [Candidatus Paceibacterota bacterium]